MKLLIIGAYLNIFLLWILLGIKAFSVTNSLKKIASIYEDIFKRFDQRFKDIESDMIFVSRDMKRLKEEKADKPKEESEK